jgi:hypothetical protein
LLKGTLAIERKTNVGHTDRDMDVGET